MGMYQPEIETMDRNELEKLQLERLQKQVKNVYENVPMYRERMDKKGVKPEDIKELKDLAKLPFTTKQDLRDYYPFDLFAADKKGYCKNTRIVGYNRQTDCSRLYKKRP